MTASGQSVAEPESAATSRSSRKMLLGLGALGVVFGDIGTSPLYAFQEIFIGDHPIPADEHRVFGAASLVFWTLTLIVSVKYVMIVMRADNDGEGGIMALASLAVRASKRTKHATAIIMTLGILGAALFYGDGMVTPAVSVLSAVQGLEIVSPGLQNWVLPIAVVILFLLFAVQRYGTGKMGAAFGPVMFVWFLVIATFGLLSIIQNPEIIEAINPKYAIGFFEGEPMTAFLALGSVVLCVTGAEALYADMGQFGRGPIRLSWFSIAMPALYLNYFGQAALVLRNPANAENPFYLMIPDSLQLPMVILATMATVIASQAVISGAFSMTKQAILLDYLPRMQVRQTSSHERGQVYVPAVNWMLMIGVLLLVVTFQTSSNLAAAYGIAVTGTFVITTCLITIVALEKWKISPWLVFPVSFVFLCIDMGFFLANLTKFDHGGWFPLAVAAVIFTVLSTWRRGRQLMIQRLLAMGRPLKEFAKQVKTQDLTVIPGSTVYLSPATTETPFALTQHTKLLGIIPEQTVILRFVTATQPKVDPADRVVVFKPAPGFVQITATIGFMDHQDVNEVMKQAIAKGVSIDVEKCTYVQHLVTIEPSKNAGMWLHRQYLFMFMQRTAVTPAAYMHLPPHRVLGVGTVVPLGTD